MRKVILFTCFMLISINFLSANPPLNLKTTITGNDVVISWSASPGADEYNVYRSEEAYNNFSQIATSNDTVHTDVGAANENKYFYYVTAINDTISFDWCFVPQGYYTYGPGDTTKTIDYDYQIMKYEITNQQYVFYLEAALDLGLITVSSTVVEGYYPGDVHYGAGDYDYINLSSGNCRINWTGSEFNIDSGYEYHPVTNVTWIGASTFADFYDLSLPTGKEWEKAARNNMGWDYAWGDSIDGSRANYKNSGDPWDNDTTPVGIYNGQTIQGFATTDSPSPYAAYDMTGNVWEWTRDWDGTSNCRIMRGGSYSSAVTYSYTWTTSSYFPTFGYNDIGFRCVLP